MSVSCLFSFTAPAGEGRRESQPSHTGPQATQPHRAPGNQATHGPRQLRHTRPRPLAHVWYSVSKCPSRAAIRDSLPAATLPREPPAESWQNSYIPSNTGQSSPTLTGRGGRGGGGGGGKGRGGGEEEGRGGGGEGERGRGAGEKRKGGKGEGRGREGRETGGEQRDRVHVYALYKLQLAPVHNAITK